MAYISKSNRIGVGVIGFGFMGRTHLEAYERCEGAEVIAVADRNPLAFAAGSEPLGNLEAGGDAAGADLSKVEIFHCIEDLIRHPQVQLISVTTPTPTHIEIGNAVIRSGRHLLMEKPVDLDAAKILDLAETARDHGVLAMPAHCMRFWPAWARLRDCIRDSRYGRVTSATFLRAGAAPHWNDGFYLDDFRSGGAIVDLHIHDTDFVMHCFGRPTAVTATGDRKYVQTTYHYPELEVTAEGGWLDTPDAAFMMRFCVEFESATIRFDMGAEPELVIEDPTGSVVGVPEIGADGTGYDRQVNALVEAIRMGHSVPPVTLQSAAETAMVLNAEIDSAERGGIRIDF